MVEYSEPAERAVVTAEEEAQIDARIKERRAGFGLTVARSAGIIDAAMGTLTLVNWVFLPEYTQLLVFGVATYLHLLGVWLYFVLCRRGRLVAAWYAFQVSFTLTIVIGPILIPLALPAAALGHVLLIILGHLILGDRHSWPAVGLSMVAFAASAGAAATQLSGAWSIDWFPPLGGTVSLVAGLGISSLALVALIMVSRGVVLGQERQYRLTLRANVLEQAQREQLEQANREIEARALAEREQRERLSHVLNRVREAAADLNAAVAEILAAATQQASGASEQSAAISQTTATVEEVQAIAAEAVERAQEVADTARRTVEASQTGQQAVEDTITGMDGIRERVELIAENIVALSEQTQQVGEIIATVSDIAAQSNILALNAAVEAARAGDEGKGFAVVAEEVRSLARQSREATAQVRAILSDIWEATSTTVLTTEEGAKVVDRGAEAVAQARAVIEQLAGVIDESAQAAMQLAAGGRQQASGVEQIALAMANINRATVQNLASTKQTERAAQDLNELAGGLARIVEEYQPPSPGARQ